MSAKQRQNLRDLVSLLRQNPEGLTTSEIGQYLGVTRQAALNYIDTLSSDGCVIYRESSRYILDRSSAAELVLSMSQAWFLYLPLRRMVRAGLNRVPLVQSLLLSITGLLHEELGDALIPQAEERDEGRARVFETLVRCWHEKRLAQIHYRAPNSAQVRHLTVQPWWFEPAVWSDAFYLIGGMPKRDGSLETLTLKIDRIQAVEALDQRFERPDQDQMLKAIEGSWGIWLAGEPSVTVRLRFHNRQLDRLRETRWHPTQRMTLEADGSVLWEAEISEPQEMLPWIRGWGADVEVLAPEDIRQRIAADAEAAARLYGRNSSTAPDYL